MCVCVCLTRRRIIAATGSVANITLRGIRCPLRSNEDRFSVVEEGMAHPLTVCFVCVCACVQELTDQEMFAEIGPCITVSVAEKPRTPMKSSKSETQAMPSPR